MDNQAAGEIAREWSEHDETGGGADEPAERRGHRRARFRVAIGALIPKPKAWAVISAGRREFPKTYLLAGRAVYVALVNRGEGEEISVTVSRYSLDDLSAEVAESIEDVAGSERRYRTWTFKTPEAKAFTFETGELLGVEDPQVDRVERFARTLAGKLGWEIT
jgi:hypothetical protein